MLLEIWFELNWIEEKNDVIMIIISEGKNTYTSA